ncbi:MAG: transglutaminase domain-containing protein [Candidatus Gracilibacteria bacterium]
MKINNIRNLLKKVKIKIILTKNRINKIKVNKFYGYGSIILVFSLFISINICNFLVCLSVKYPELNIGVNNSQQIASLKYENITVTKNTDTINTLSIDEELLNHKQISSNSSIEVKENNTEFNSASEKELDSNNKYSEEEIKIEKNLGIPTTTKEQIKPLVKPEIKENIITQVNKSIVKPRTKDVIVTPVIKTTVNLVATNTTDTTYLNVNNEINGLLDKLNADIFRGFKLKTVKNNNIFLENGTRYTYVYKNYKNFGKGIIPSKNDLQLSGLDKNTTLLLLDDTIGASFVTDYIKVKLISDNIILGITNKQEFLNELADDKKSLNTDTDKLFLSLKTETINLTKGLSESDKIYKIYDYILKNISYSTKFSLDNKEIFSGIDTYKNKNGICGGYTKLYVYMLSFAGVSGAKVIRGDVLDAPDFPNIGHAWVKIGTSYYDPTFDDPVGAIKTKTYSEYKYFGLPKDIFYTNKYDYGTLPSYLKTESLESRENLIRDSLSKLIPKYESKNYLLLKPFTFRINNGLNYNEKITIEKLKTIIPYYEVNNYEYIENNQVKKISNIDYYTTNDSNLEILLEQVGYNVDGLKLFKWDDGNYRLSYNVNAS